MKTILITGLDGSGKSTIFSRLKSENPRQVGFLNLPYFDLENLPAGFTNKSVCAGINFMSDEADKLHQPLLKIIGMFSAMVLFSKIEAQHQHNGKTILITERHPLIDASMYAKIYLKYLNPVLYAKDDFYSIDKSYMQHIQEILQILHVSISENESPSNKLLELIYKLFGPENKTNLNELSTFFSCSMPSEIYFLHAPATVLMQRISARSTKEHHESEEKLDELRTLYLNYLNQFSEVRLIDASNFETLNAFTEEIQARW